ncbi:MAG: HEAT repeat domain-containing protein [Acidobacteriota bacterium]|nr:HEAT repeat domain-containing protein [Acidobacteriota bacterium]
MPEQVSLSSVRAVAALALGLAAVACGPAAESPIKRQARANVDEGWQKGEPRLKLLTLSLLVDHERLAEAHAIVEEAVTSPSTAMRLDALGVLSEWEDPATVDVLRPLIEDSSDIVRLSAARLLARLGVPDGKPLLVEALRDRDGLLSVDTCAALAVIGSEECAEQAAEDLSARDADRVRAAAEALAATGGDRARDALRGALKKLRGEKRASVIEALGRIGTAEDVARVVPFARYTVYVLAVIRALGDVGGDEAIRELQKYLSTNDPLAALEAAGALLKARGPSEDVLSVLDASIASDRKELRFLSARLLSSAPPRPETEVLLARLVGDADAQVRREALNGLTRGVSESSFPAVQAAWQATRSAHEGLAYEAAQRALVVAARIPGSAADDLLEEAMGSDNWAHVLQASLGLLGRGSSGTADIGG